MNTTDCPAGFATDSAFYPVASGVRCDTSVAAFVGVLVVVTVMRAGALVQQVRTHAARQRRRRSEGKAEARRVPRMVATNAAVVVMYVVLFALVGTNVANASNSLAWALLGLGFVGFCLWNAHTVQILVRLGARIAPLRGAGPGPRAAPHVVSDSSASGGTVASKPGLPDHAATTDSSFLERLDGVLNALFALQFVCVAVGSLLLIFLGPFMHDLLVPFGQAALALKGVFVLLACASIDHQINRVRHFVGTHMRTLMVGGAGQAGLDEASHAARIADFARARKRLTVIMVITTATYLPMVMFFFLQAARVLPWTWVWTMAVPAYFETTGRVLMDCVVFAPKRARRGRPPPHQAQASPGDQGLPGSAAVTVMSTRSQRQTATQTQTQTGGVLAAAAPNADHREPPPPSVSSPTAVSSFAAA